MRTIFFILLMFNVSIVFASNIIPTGSNNNMLYYKIGGGNDFSLPPVSDTDTIALNTNANLGLGNSCGAFNPALSVMNSMNDLKDSSDNLTKDIIGNATGSIIEMPMYELARKSPALYSLINNNLLSANKKLEISTKSCDTVKSQIASGQNPYQDWGTLAVNDQWKKKLSLTSTGDEDINHAKKDIDTRTGDDGVTWVNGNKDSDGSTHAGGKGQTPIHVIADTTKSGYNALLNRDLGSDEPANTSGTSSELAKYFPTPSAASNWITNVIGDQTITTCVDDSCKKSQGSVVGHGLLPWITSCNQDKDNCAETIKGHLTNLVTGNETITKDNLERVSADGIAVSPEVISSLRALDNTQQAILVNKLAQEVSIQRIINKAFIARNILSTGAQVPVIAANHPAQIVIGQAITNLDNDIRAITFESQVRKQMMSDTMTQILSFNNQQKTAAMNISPVSVPQPLMENGAIQNSTEKQ